MPSPTHSATLPARYSGWYVAALWGEGPKYSYPAGVDVGRLLFNYTPDHRNAVVLCEGALDAIALWNSGVDAFAIYGSRLSVEQVMLIEQDRPRVRGHLLRPGPGRSRWPTVTPSAPSPTGWWTGSPGRGRWGKDIDEIGATRRRKVVHELVSSGVDWDTVSTWMTRTSADYLEAKASWTWPEVIRKPPGAPDQADGG